MQAEGLTIASVGCGNMGFAIMGGLAKSCSCTLLAYDPNSATHQPLKDVGIRLCDDVSSMVRMSDIIIVAVKPHQVPKVLADVAPSLTADKLVLSIAAGVGMSTLRNSIDHVCPVVLCMPNTPALVGAGVFALCFEDTALRAEQKSIVLELFQGLGLCFELPEKQFTAFAALIGAGPAYVFHFMNALVQAGVTLGFSRVEARAMVDALVAGSATMSEHMFEQAGSPLIHLRDQVCSPAGLTIAGVNHMERKAVSGHVVDAVLEAYKRGQEMER